MLRNGPQRRPPEGSGWLAYGLRAGIVGLTLFTCLLGAGLLGPGTTHADVVDEEVAAVRSEVVETLYGLFLKCKTSKLFIVCNDLASEILTHDPEHERARRWLTHVRRDGRWVEDGPPPKRRNWSKEALERYPARRSKTLAPLGERLYVLLPRLDEPRHRRRRAEVIDLLIRIQPDDPRYREANYEVQHDGRWILEESRRTLECETLLEAKARDILDAVPSPEGIPTPTVLRRFKLRWREARRGRRVTSCSTHAWEEADAVVRHVQAAEGLFQAVFASRERLPNDFSVACVTGEEEQRLIVGELEVPREEKLRLMTLGGFWLPKTNTVVQVSDEPPRRLDGGVRQALNTLFRREFGRFGRLGWASEGIGIYLTHLLTGTRLTFFVRRTEYGEGASSKNLAGADADWLAMAADLDRAGELPDLPYVTSVDLNTMTAGDMLMAHALAAYLLTGRADEAAAFLQAADKGTKTEQAAIEVLGLDLRLLDRRLRRWLAEVR